MKTLFLLRHAQASLGDQATRDFERPLTAQGRQACESVSAILKQEKIVPQVVVSSSAVRARETIEIVMRTAGLQTVVQFDERIYEASVSGLLAVISELPSEIQTA